MKSYTDRKAEFRAFRDLADRKVIRYFRSFPGPEFTIYFNDIRGVDPILLALFLASAEKAFGAGFSVIAAGYGCFRVTYTVVAESREEAEKIALYMASSKRIKSLTKSAASTGIVVQSIQASQKARELLDRADGNSMEMRQAIEAIGIVEDEMGIDPSPNESPKERLEKLQTNAMKEPPPADSSYWRLGDLIGAIMGGFTKSLGGG
ncbi:hypothetical protein [Salipiger sp.]|uniref:hypothetical protein n=1 Tax=Salipiger sp. TaxID=2078585 RepID=UPI003A98339B